MSQKSIHSKDQSTDFIDESIRQEYNILQKLGKGSYGHVWKVQSKKTKQIFSLKKIFSGLSNEMDSQRTFREVSILSKICHPNIIKLEQILPLKTNKKDLYLLFEYTQSDLFRCIKHNILDRIHKKVIVYQLVMALKYLHSKTILHRDLKPSNILITQNCIAKICDFGMARTFKKASNTPQILTEFVPTRWYQAPEIIFGSKCYGPEADIWSLGCLIYQIYAIRVLLPGESQIEQIIKFLEFKGKPNMNEMNSFGNANAQKIISFFNTDKKDENYYYQSIKDAHPQDYELLKKLLDRIFEVNPSKRIKASQILQNQFFSEIEHILGIKLENVLLKEPEFKPITLELDESKQYSSREYIKNIQALIKHKQCGSSNQKYKNKSVGRRFLSTQRKSCEFNLSNQQPQPMKNHFARKKYQHQSLHAEIFNKFGFIQKNTNSNNFEDKKHQIKRNKSSFRFSSYEKIKQQKNNSKESNKRQNFKIIRKSVAVSRHTSPQKEALKSKYMKAKQNLSHPPNILKKKPSKMFKA